MEQILRELSLRRRLAVGKREGGGGNCLAKGETVVQGRKRARKRKKWWNGEIVQMCQ